MRRFLAVLAVVAAACAPLGEPVSSDTLTHSLSTTTTPPVPPTTIPAPTTTATTSTTAGPVEAPAEAAVDATPAALPDDGSPYARFGDPRTVGRPTGSVPGLLAFRGNPTRTWYGTGPMPDEPAVLWEYGPLCGPSTVGGETTTWCGTGWTGQPVVWERPDGITEVIFGAYDHAVHFLDAATGRPTRPPFATGDLIKGSVTLDPDGYPLLYFGSRDDRLRVVALDRDRPTELWAINANEWQGKWNNDWDGNPLVIDDLLLEGGENSIFYAVKLNRAYGADGLVGVDPEILVTVPSWNDTLTSSLNVRRNDVSIENSVAVFDGVVYFANSGGRVMGLDVTEVETGRAPLVFDYWVGDDVDASIVIDARGVLYVSVELERFTSRSEQLGQIVALDPARPDEPLLWGVPVPPREGGNGGLWATPALGDGVLYAATHPGELLAVRTATGEVAWRDEIGFHAWSSPVLIDETLLVSVNCELGGGLRAYSLADPFAPAMDWQLDLGGGCIESTPAVWEGVIYVGSRDGYFRAFG